MVSKLCKEVTIAYIGGGSKGWAWGLMADLALDNELCGVVKLYDIDFGEAMKNEIIGNLHCSLPNANSNWRYQAVGTLREALAGADFVIISILPGTFAEMWSDVHLPEKYGIYQSVGDTTGPGGLIRALRSVPMYAEFARNIEAFAPTAWVINYTNPMSICVRTLYEVFPRIKAFGCCHGVFEVQELLVEVLSDLKHISGVQRTEITTNVLGINHFTWIDEAYYKDIDLLSLYGEFSELYYKSGYEVGQYADWKSNFFTCANRVQFDLFRRYGFIPCPSDRHLAEFVPGYLTTPESVKEWKFGLTPVSWRIERKRQLEAQSAALISGRAKPELKPSGEEGVLQMKALLGLADLVTNVNLPNIGQVDGLPRDAVVETNALISNDSVKPVLAGTLPSALNSLVTRHLLNYESILSAGLRGDKELAFRAFISDPLVTLDIVSARELFDEMVANTSNYHKL